MNGKKLLELLQKMSPEQLEREFSVYICGEDETYPVSDMFVQGYGSEYDGLAEVDDDELVLVIGELENDE